MRLYIYVAKHKFNHQWLKLQQIFIFIISGLPPYNSFLTVSIDNEKLLFFYLSRHVRSWHIVYGQATWYMDTFYQATLCRWTVLKVHTDG